MSDYPGNGKVWEKGQRAQAVRGGMPLTIQLTFLAFVASLPFESILSSERFGNIVSISRIIGYVFMLAVLVQAQRLRFKVSLPIILFAVFLVFTIFLELIQGSVSFASVRSTYFMAIQLLVMLVIASSLLANTRFQGQMLLTLALSGAIAAVVQISGVGAEVHDNLTQVAERLSVTGNDSNWSATDLGWSLLAAMSVASGALMSGKTVRLAAIFTAIPITLAIIQTGSRGGLLGIVVGILIWTALQLRPRGRFRGLILVLGFVVCGLLVYFALSNDMLLGRLKSSLYGADLATRDQIWRLAIEKFGENPLWGYGYINYACVVGNAVGKYMLDTHNLFLAVALQGGIIGLVLYGAAWSWIIARLLPLRHTPFGAFAVSTVASLAVWNLSLSLHQRKMHWIIVAFALGVIYSQRKVVATVPRNALNFARWRRSQRGWLPAGAEPEAPGTGPEALSGLP